MSYKNKEDTDLPFLFLMAAVVIVGLGFFINFVFLNTILIVAIISFVVFVFRPSWKLLLPTFIIFMVLSLYFQETLIESWKYGQNIIARNFEGFSQLSLRTLNDYAGGVLDSAKFHIVQLTSVKLYLLSALIAVPVGIILGYVTILIYDQKLGRDHYRGAKKKLKPNKKTKKVSKTYLKKINKMAAVYKGSTLIGGMYKNRPVTIADSNLNKHCLVLGPTGSGKTVTICNIVESFLDRNLPVIFIDGKGDGKLSNTMINYAEEKDIPTYYFSADDKRSCHYDPFSVGDFTSLKDRVMATLDWSEIYYKNAANVYLQTVLKVMKRCNSPISFASIIEYMNQARLAQLLRENQNNVDNVEALATEIQNLNIEEKNLQGLMLGLQAFANSEVGVKLEKDELKSTLKFKGAIDSKALTYVSLKPLAFPEHAKAFGRLMINDLKATLSEYLDNSAKVLIVFDEFSSFSGAEVLNLINQSRSAGAHIVTGTQSIADFDRSVTDNGGAFCKQILSNHKNIIVHALNSAEDAELFSRSIGTNIAYEPTVQIDEDGLTGMGSIRETNEFILHPNVFKNLETGEAIYIQTTSKEKPKFVKVRKSNLS